MGWLWLWTWLCLDWRNKRRKEKTSAVGLSLVAFRQQCPGLQSAAAAFALFTALRMHSMLPAFRRSIFAHMSHLAVDQKAQQQQQQHKAKAKGNRRWLCYIVAFNFANALPNETKVGSSGSGNRRIKVSHLAALIKYKMRRSLCGIPLSLSLSLLPLQSSRCRKGGHKITSMCIEICNKNCNSSCGGQMAKCICQIHIMQKANLWPLNWIEIDLLLR